MSLTRRTSLRDMFKSKSRSPLVEEKPEPLLPATPRAAYVPASAASGFSNTVRSPRAFHTSLPMTQEELAADPSSLSFSSRASTKDEGAEARELAARMRRNSRMLMRPGHLFIETPRSSPFEEADLDTTTTTTASPTTTTTTTLVDTPAQPTDFQAFIAAAKAQEEALMYFTRTIPVESSPRLVPLRRHRDSGYSSASFSPLKEAPSVPSALWHAAAAPPRQREDADRTLRKRQSLRIVGQRIADYVRPMDLSMQSNMAVR